MIIRKDVSRHMAELKEWLAETEAAGPENMDAFFTRRVDGYEEHMSIWRDAYRCFAELLPQDPGEVLDLGVGTGLELDDIWKLNPAIKVTGVDMSQAMLDVLAQKHSDKNLTIVCEDYFRFDMGENRWKTVISFESCHHFLHDEKLKLYKKIYRGLKEGGCFILGDYIACCDEEEDILREAYIEKRKRYQIPEGQFIHLDIPMTLEHETAIMHEAGFHTIHAKDSINGATMIVAAK